MKVEDVQKRVSQIGSIVGWLQSIEFLLRWWLARHGGHDIVLPTHLGQVMESTPITDYRSLGQLVSAYNGQLSAEEAAYCLDPQIVEIRDAHAHGRSLAIEGENFLTLYRFSPPRDGKVTTIGMKALTPEVLEAEMDLLRDQWSLLHACGTTRGYFH